MNTKEWEKEFDGKYGLLKEKITRLEGGLVMNPTLQSKFFDEVKSFITELLSEATKDAVDRELVHKIANIVIEKEMKMLQRCWAKKFDLYAVVCDRVNRPFLDNDEADDVISLLHPKDDITSNK